uniref:Zn(2)-C6 fungal-type domain-containing protein n=1 Tax=Mycena chlorophos TaxID=658473 RepID=A0ABQ0L052_MYCCL|nr:predicted protein [Mycena chlorophos]
MENLKSELTMPLQRRARIACEQCSISKVKCERHDKLNTLSPCDRCVERGYVCASREKARPRGNGHRKQPREAGVGSAVGNPHSKRRRSEAEVGLPVPDGWSGRHRRSAPSLELSFPYGATAPPLPEPMATTSTSTSHPHPEAEPSTRALYGELTLKPDERIDSDFDTTIFYPKPVQGWDESFSFKAHEPSYHYVPVDPQNQSPHSTVDSRSALDRDHSEAQSLCYSQLMEAQALYYTPDASSIPRSLATATWPPTVASADSMDVHWMGARSRLELAFIKCVVILRSPEPGSQSV